MLRIFTTLFLAAPALYLPGQTFKEKEIKSNIREVTVFLDAAQIYESAHVIIPAGTTILRVRNLSPFLDHRSIQVRSDGDFTILAVNHKLNHLDELKKSWNIDSLNRLVESINLSISRENARLAVLKDKQTLLNENRSLRGERTGVSIAELKQAMDFFDAQITLIREEEITTKRRIESHEATIAQLRQELKELNARKALPTGEVEIRVSAESQVNGDLTLTYVVSNAGWYPKYDVRVDDIKSPLLLTYKAEVFQNTGVDWNNVKLRFSNADPKKSGLVPELRTWHLNYARNTTFARSIHGLTMAGDIRNVNGRVISSEDGTPIPGVNVLIKGTTVGTVTDANGNYSLPVPHNASHILFSFIGLATQEVPISQTEVNVTMEQDIAELNELVVTGYSGGGVMGRAAGVQVRGNKSIERIIQTTVIENQTTVEIEVATPYTIKSTGEKLQVDLRQYKIPASFEYYAVPKIDQDAFLIARITGWDQYHLLEGEANLYFEDAFVGRSVLDTRSMSDTLTLSLGRDRNIMIGRERVEEFSRRRMIGLNTVETRGFRIVARNKKSQPAKITIFDQIPVSVVNDITVEPVEISKGRIDQKDGTVTWELSIEPQQQKELVLQYEVKYPRREKVILE